MIFDMCRLYNDNICFACLFFAISIDFLKSVNLIQAKCSHVNLTLINIKLTLKCNVTLTFIGHLIVDEP